MAVKSISNRIISAYKILKDTYSHIDVARYSFYVFFINKDSSYVYTMQGSRSVLAKVKDARTGTISAEFRDEEPFESVLKCVISEFEKKCSIMPKNTKAFFMHAFENEIEYAFGGFSVIRFEDALLTSMKENNISLIKGPPEILNLKYNIKTDFNNYMSNVANYQQEDTWDHGNVFRDTLTQPVGSGNVKGIREFKVR